MKHIIRFGALGGVLLLSIAGNPVTVLAVGDQPSVIIAEVSPEAADSPSKEYVQLYNPGQGAVNVKGWRLQYRSASHTPDSDKDWVNKAILGCQSTKVSDCASPVDVIASPGETLRISSYEAGDGIVPLASGMATTGGELRLVDAQGVVHDKVGYGTAKDYEGDKPAPAPLAGRSIVRIQDEEGAYVDTDHNDLDFELSPDENIDVQPDPAPVADPPAVTPGQGAGPVSYAAPEITEVLPDPASPQLDSNDEFIELYNPYGDALDLNGYVLKTGTSWTHKYTITESVIDPYGYVAFTSAQTHLTLSNSGSGVQLYDPAGNLLFEVPAYTTAKTGDSWVRDSGGQWVWTTKPTPGEQNIIEVPVEAVAKAATPAASKKPATKAATTAKKASTPKTTGAVKAATTTAIAQPAAGSTQGNQAGMWALGVAGVLGVGYGMYEYRQDIGTFARQRWQQLASVAGRR